MKMMKKASAKPENVSSSPMKYRIDTATDTIRITLPDGDEVTIPKSDPVWEDIIEFIFGGGGSDHEFMRLIEGVQNRQEGR
jgi:hypothetical protein